MNNNEDNKNVVVPVQPENSTQEAQVKVMPVVETVQPVQTIQVQPTNQVVENPEVKQVDTINSVEQTPQPRVEIENNKDKVVPVTPVEEETERNGPTTFAKIMTTLLFIFLFAFVYFLGDINDYINTKKLEKMNAEIANGKLICSNETSTENLDVKVSATFTFENKKVTGLTFITTSSGDKIKDKKELEGLRDKCNLLKEEVKSYEGISVVCSLNSGIISTKQIFNYTVLDAENVRSSYAEAGGVYPQFNHNEDINSVESKMIASDYLCEKISD